MCTKQCMRLQKFIPFQILARNYTHAQVFHHFPILRSHFLLHVHALSHSAVGRTLYDFTQHYIQFVYCYFPIQTVSLALPTELISWSLSSRTSVVTHFTSTHHSLCNSLQLKFITQAIPRHYNWRRGWRLTALSRTFNLTLNPHVRSSAYLEHTEICFATNKVEGKRKSSVLLSISGANSYGHIRSLLAPDWPQDTSHTQLAWVFISHFEPNTLPCPPPAPLPTQSNATDVADPTTTHRTAALLTWSHSTWYATTVARKATLPPPAKPKTAKSEPPEWHRPLHQVRWVKMGGADAVNLLRTHSCEDLQLFTIRKKSSYPIIVEPQINKMLQIGYWGSCASHICTTAEPRTYSPLLFSTPVTWHSRLTRTSEWKSWGRYWSMWCMKAKSSHLIAVAGAHPSLFGCNWLEKSQINRKQVLSITTSKTMDKLRLSSRSTSKCSLMSWAPSVTSRQLSRCIQRPSPSLAKVVPYSLRQAVEQELECLEAEGIL